MKNDRRPSLLLLLLLVALMLLSILLSLSFSRSHSQSYSQSLTSALAIRQVFIKLKTEAWDNTKTKNGVEALQGRLHAATLCA